MIWSIYRLDTGVFTGQKLSGPRLHKSNIPAGCSAFEGEVDHRQKRLNIETGDLVDFTPPPDDPFVIQSRELSAAMGEIEALEKLQIRSMSDLFDNQNDQAARENYERRKGRIAELRQRVTSGRETIARVQQPR